MDRLLGRVMATAALPDEPPLPFLVAVGVAVVAISGQVIGSVVTSLLVLDDAVGLSVYETAVLNLLASFVV